MRSEITNLKAVEQRFEHKDDFQLHLHLLNDNRKIMFSDKRFNEVIFDQSKILRGVFLASIFIADKFIASLL
jgi:hypothetical protein